MAVGYSIVRYILVHFLLLSQHVFSLKWKFSKYPETAEKQPLTLATEPYALSIHQSCLMTAPSGFYLCWGNVIVTSIYWCILQ